MCHHFGRSLLAGTHRRKAASLGILKQVREKTNRKPIAVRDVLAGDRYGLIVALKRLVRSCVLAETERALRCGMRVGKLTECWVYDADQRPADEHWAQIDQQSAVKQIRSRRSISYCDEPEAAE